MSRAYAMTPSMPFAMPTPVGRRIEVVAKKSWAILFLLGAVMSTGYYVFLMNSTASKGYTLRTQEKQLEQLHASVSTLENKAAQLQALYTIESRVRDMGYVAVDRMEFVDAARGYAFAR